MRLILRRTFMCATLLINAVVQAQKPIGDYRCQYMGGQPQLDLKASANIDVQKYSIVLDMTDFNNQRITGYTTVHYKSIADLNEFELDLEALQVDSVVTANLKNFTHKGNTLTITLNKTLSKGASDSVRVYYGGKPTKDASWGGFYYSGDYAFNLGVAFTSAPHNYGRVWFPCVDNFTDRAVYEFTITCTADKTAMCNGILTDMKEQGGNRTFYWVMNDPIPTYLASVAVAPYTINEWKHSGVPVVLSAVKADSADMAASFMHLNDCIDAYLTRYGTHNFDRVGFNLVPFNGGAMEHATNIAYPRFGADGKLTYETLFAHEFGHHWWGNTVTCRTAEDMWINEGWASYSERVFLEYVYGRERYDEDISANHRAVLHYAHLRDGDTLPVSGIGHDNTYGMHVYDKGADVVHTLRGYMGDSAFFKAVQSFLTDYKFKDVSSGDLEAHFQKFTSYDLKAFFNNWIYNPGFPHFDVLGYQTSQKGNSFETKINLRQRLRFAPDYFDNVPMEITLFGPDFQLFTQKVEIGGERDQVMVTTDFQPVFVALDFNKRISDAITDEYHMISDTGMYNFGDALMTMHVREGEDSSLVRIEHNWVGADAYFTDNTTPFISRERYWTVDGIWNSNFKADATIEYYGRETGTNYAVGYLDVDLIRGTEDSMVLMYRPNASAKWKVCSDYSWEMGSRYDKRGSFTIHNVQKGQYCFGIHDGARLSAPEDPVVANEYVNVYPNPASDVLNIEIRKAKNGRIEITDMKGRLVFSDTITSRKCCKPVDVSQWTRGIYFIGVVIDEKPYQPKPVLIR